MNYDEALNTVINIITDALDGESKINENVHLIGVEAILDSMKLVEVCLALEDIGEDEGFDFDWTSEAAMSKSQSIFRTVKSLAEEFSAQSKKGELN